MVKLAGKGRTGDAVHAGQKMAAEDGFKNVSKKWLDQCISYDQAMEQLTAGHAKTDDLKATVAEMVPVVDGKGSFALEHGPSGRRFRPTRFAVSQMAGWARCGEWFPTSLMDVPKDSRGKQLFSRDRGDAETLAAVFRNGFRRIDPAKPFLWRTRKDGTLRAMLSDRYAVVNNEWFIDALRRIVPGGLCSHWKGDCDTIWGNVLIPDSVREEDDSDYGGMLSISNSEIGERQLSSCPSVFRAICQNGCIWDQEVGGELVVRHVGKLDLDGLFVMLKEHLEAQIPLLPQGIERLLGTRAMGWDGPSVLPLFAQVARQFRLSRVQATAVLDGYNAERAVIGDDLARTLFGVTNAVTRAGQRLSNAEWVRLDEIGGSLAGYDREDWGRLTSRAKSLKLKEVEESFALAN